VDLDELGSFLMHDVVTTVTKGHKVLLLIATRMAAELLMVHL